MEDMRFERDSLHREVVKLEEERVLTQRMLLAKQVRRVCVCGSSHYSLPAHFPLLAHSLSLSLRRNCKVLAPACEHTYIVSLTDASVSIVPALIVGDCCCPCYCYLCPVLVAG